MAALDLLAARDDVDAGRLGVTGASGGGFVSTFVAAARRRRRRGRHLLHPQHARRRSCATPPSAPAGTAGSTSATRCRGSPPRRPWGMVLAAAAPRRRDRRARDRRPAVPDRRRARRRAPRPQPCYDALGAGGRARLVEVSGGHGLHPQMREAAAAALATPLGLPAPAARGARAAARVRLRRHARRRARRSAAAQTHVRAPARLPGEALAASVDTNPVLVGIARARGSALRRGREPSLADRDGVHRARRRGRPDGVRGVVTNHVVPGRAASASDSRWTSRRRSRSTPCFCCPTAGTTRRPACW